MQPKSLEQLILFDFLVLNIAEPIINEIFGHD